MKAIVPFSSITKDTKVKVIHISDDSISRCNKNIKPLVEANAKERRLDKVYD